MAKFHDCAYSNAAGTAIDATLTASGVRTTLTATDSVTKADYQLAKGGAYGAVAPYVEPVATKGQLVVYTQNKVAAILGSMRTYDGPPGVGGSIKSDATSGTISHLLALVDWGNANPTSTNNWIANDGTIQSVTGEQIAAIVPLVGDYARTIYSSEMSDVLDKIGSGTITTFDQIDLYPWTV